MTLIYNKTIRWYDEKSFLNCSLEKYSEGTIKKLTSMIIIKKNYGNNISFILWYRVKKNNLVETENLSTWTPEIQVQNRGLGWLEKNVTWSSFGKAWKALFGPPGCSGGNFSVSNCCWMRWYSLLVAGTVKWRQN